MSDFMTPETATTTQTEPQENPKLYERKRRELQRQLFKARNRTHVLEPAVPANPLLPDRGTITQTTDWKDVVDGEGNEFSLRLDVISIGERNVVEIRRRKSQEHGEGHILFDSHDVDNGASKYGIRMKTTQHVEEGIKTLRLLNAALLKRNGRGYIG